MAEAKVKKSPAKKAATSATKKPVVAPQRDVHRIDATDQIVGRLATRVSVLLRGKDRPDFQRHLDAASTVVVTNAGKMKVTGTKMTTKKYYHFSGYQGGLKAAKMGDVFAQDPSEVLRRAVWNMLPKNKLRDQMIKRLMISN